MKIFLSIAVVVFILPLPRPVCAQYKDSVTHFSLRSLAIPAVMAGYGILALENKGLKHFNMDVKDEVYLDNPHQQIHADNYLQFAPAAAVYGLNIIGVKGKHNFRDRTMIYVMSNILVNATVFSVKALAHQLRPDSSSYTSFPSGHTAEAFCSAEFLWQEYKEVSPWYGIAGYGVAVATGYLRLYNNKHWFSDVVAGAGIGMGFTKIAFWLYPKIQHRLFKDKPVHTMVMPVYANGSFGFQAVHLFGK